MDENDESIDQSPQELFYTAVIFESLLGLFALFLGWVLGPDPRSLIPELNTENLGSIGRGLAYGCAAAIPMLAVIALIRKIPCAAVRELERLGEDGMIRALLQLGRGELVVISMCAGVGEELLFRGWLLPWLAHGGSKSDPSSWEWGFALVGSAVAFGLVHPLTKLYIFLAAAMGLYFGLLLFWTDNLLVPIAAHAAYDAVQLLMPSFEKKGRQKS